MMSWTNNCVHSIQLSRTTELDRQHPQWISHKQHTKELWTMSSSKDNPKRVSEWGDFGGINPSRKSKKIYVDKDSLNERHEESIRNTKHWREHNKRQINWWLLSPLAIAPVLPMIRIGFRHNPALRDRLFKWTLGGAVAHGALLISGVYSDDA